MTYHDIEAVDPDYYKNLKWMLEVGNSISLIWNLALRNEYRRNDIFFNIFAIPLYQNDVSDIPDLTFSMDADEEKHILYEKTEVFAT